MARAIEPPKAIARRSNSLGDQEDRDELEGQREEADIEMSSRAIELFDGFLVDQAETIELDMVKMSGESDDIFADSGPIHFEAQSSKLKDQFTFECHFARVGG